MPLDSRISMEAAKAFNYEYQMFLYLYKRINTESSTADDSLKNLLIEGFLLHARVLFYFFCDEPKDDDISAQHFFEEANTWKQQKETLCPYLRTNRIRMNKKLAHLTYTRITDNGGWNIQTIAKELSDSQIKYLSLLPEKSKMWFLE